LRFRVRPVVDEDRETGRKGDAERLPKPSLLPREREFDSAKPLEGDGEKPPISAID
jgi:hypothetical protein